jgi:hypothetical protein
LRGCELEQQASFLLLPFTVSPQVLPHFAEYKSGREIR